MGETDWIRRDATIEALNKLIDRFELILRDIRESNEDESVCGLCEYDGAFIGQSGDWCNECPGFDRADCFKLSDRRRKKWLKELGLPSTQPEIIKCKDCKFSDEFDGDVWLCRRRKESFRVLAIDTCNYAERRTDE